MTPAELQALVDAASPLPWLAERDALNASLMEQLRDCGLVHMEQDQQIASLTAELAEAKRDSDRLDSGMISLEVDGEWGKRRIRFIEQDLRTAIDKARGGA